MHPFLRFARWLRLPIALWCVVAILASVWQVSMNAISLAHAGPGPDVRVSQQGASQQAKKHFRDGQRMFAMGRFRQALASYEKAYKLFAHPDILFNIAQCYRNIGDYETAIAHFRDYLKLHPDADNQTAVRDLIARLETELANADQQKPSKPAQPPVTPPSEGKTTKLRKGANERTSSAPLYKRWWLWAGLAAIAGGGTAYYLSTRGGELPGSDLGNIDFPK